MNVSGPFHSPMLKPAGEELEKELEQTELHPLAIPYYTNVTAKKVEDIRETKALLKEQVSAPVRWMQSVEQMIAVVSIHLWRSVREERWQDFFVRSTGMLPYTM